jgi:hypothetical protein
VGRGGRPLGDLGKQLGQGQVGRRLAHVPGPGPVPVGDRDIPAREPFRARQAGRQGGDVEARIVGVAGRVSEAELVDGAVRALGRQVGEHVADPQRGFDAGGGGGAGIAQEPGDGRDAGDGLFHGGGGQDQGAAEAEPHQCLDRRRAGEQRGRLRPLVQRAMVHAPGRPGQARVQAVGGGVDAQVLARGEDVHAEHRVPEQRGEALKRGHARVARRGRPQPAEERLGTVEAELERAEALVHRAVGHRHLVPLVGGELGVVVERCRTRQPDGGLGVGVLPGA